MNGRAIRPRTDMDAPVPAVPLSAQLECVRRELNLRRRVYPRWVQAGKMSQRLAHEQLILMEAVERTLAELQPNERLL